MNKFVPLHQYTRQRISISDFEIDLIFDFFRYGTRMHSLSWQIEYDSIELDELPEYINDNYLMCVK